MRVGYRLGQFADRVFSNSRGARIALLVGAPGS